MVARSRGPRKRPVEPHGRGCARVGTSNLGGREGKQQGQVPSYKGDPGEGAKTIGTSACKDSELGPGQQGTSAGHKCQKRKQTKSKRTTNIKHQQEQKIKSKTTETTKNYKKERNKEKVQSQKDTGTVRWSKLHRLSGRRWPVREPKSRVPGVPGFSAFTSLPRFPVLWGLPGSWIQVLLQRYSQVQAHLQTTSRA